MKEDLDLGRLAEIPDPFADSVEPPECRLSPANMAASPPRHHLCAVRVAAVGGGLAFDGAWVLFIDRRPDLGSIQALQLVLGLGVPLFAALIAVCAVARRGEVGLGEPKARTVTLAVASAALFAVATAALAPPSLADDLFWRRAVGCMMVTGPLAVGPLALGIFAFRRAFAAASAWRAGALGTASGALAAATMSLVCPINSASHVIVGHGAIIVIAAVVGAVLGRRICRA
jgi:hypothetical protein